MNFGLLGRKLGHSYSPQIHSKLGSYAYNLFEIEPDDLSAFMTSGNFQGLNVTIPYKKSVIAYCDELSPIGKRLGAVNTVIRKANGKLIGHNTDYYGFNSMIARSGLQVTGKKVLILGSGGASATVCAALQDMGANPVVISRTGENNYQNLHLHKDAAIIVNATPVGMFPDNGHSPVDLTAFDNLEGVLDLIYNPARTKLLLDAEQRGLVTLNGLWMLVAQAKESAEWFTGSNISDTVIETIHHQLRSQMENIILIGMPGCGKSSIGKELARLTGKNYIDADEMIVSHCQKTIPEIFAHIGEDGFRQIETEVLGRCGAASGSIIATGGGCVTREENYPLLHQNGWIVCIDRAIDQLSREGRPLSLSGSLEDMYRQRRPLYERFADIFISNHTTPEEAAQAIVNLMEEYI